MLGLWPGGKELPGKKHRPGWPSSWRLRPTSAACGGPNGRPAGRPYKERTPSSEVQRVGPPGPWSGSRLMVFVRKVLAPGPGTGPKATFGNNRDMNFCHCRTPTALKAGLLQRRPVFHFDPAAEREPATPVRGEYRAFAVLEIGEHRLGWAGEVLLVRDKQHIPLNGPCR